MKVKRLIWLALCAGYAILLTACTKYQVVETGLSNGKHNSTMMDYFRQDPYNYSLLIELIERADLVQEFSHSTGEGITFFAPVNHNIRIYLYQQGEAKRKALQDEAEEQGNYEPITYKATDYSIGDIPQELCRELVLSTVLAGKYMLKDIPRGAKSTDEGSVIGQGGVQLASKAGRKLWLYTFQEPYADVPASGAISLNVVSPTAETNTRCASTDIETLSGIVHAMPYGFVLGKIR